MATKEQEKFKKKKLFKVARELNISTDRVEEFLTERGYEDALSGSGLTAKITDEEAYYVLLDEYADDAQAAERVRELRQAKDEGVDRDEVASIGDGQSEGEDVPTPEGASEDEPTAEAEAVEADAADATAQADDADTSDAVTDAAAEATESDEALASDDAVAEGESEAVAEDAAAQDASIEGTEAEDAATADADAEETAPEDTADAEADEAVAEAEEAETTAQADVDAEAEAADAVDADEAAADEPVADADAAEADAESAPAEASADVADADSEDSSSDDAVADAEATASADADAADAEVSDADAVDTDAEADADVETADVETEDAEAVAETDESEEAEAEASTSDDDTSDALADSSIVAPDEDLEIDTDDVEDVEEVAEEDEQPETLKADRYRLSGTQVVGKVDLDQLTRPKRKRKRKKKKSDDDSDDSKSRKDRSRKKSKKKKNKGRRRKKNRGVDEEDVEQTIQETLQELEQGASRARQRRRRRRREKHERERERRAEEKAEREGVLRVTEYSTTGELANLMGEPVGDIIQVLFDAGMMVSINQRLDRETIEFVAAEFDMEAEFIDEFSGTNIEIQEDDEADLEDRAPVVTVMGHVDHGKTSLLDYIRSANVVGGEEGGITQHIGAYNVELTDHDDAAVTFLDTPGHEAFTAMRARGAKATDIVILVVAADDSVMPQTIEAINHAQAADVPIVVAINKMDKPEADPDRVKGELAEHNVLVEEYGGTVQVAEVSAKTGDGIDDLLEKVNLQAEIMELKANPNRQANGVVIESRLEKGRGNVITVLVKNGSLSVGDAFVAGIYSGRVRAMFDERDQRIEEVGPSHPALVLGCDGSPEVGDQFVVLEDEGEARDIAQERQRIHREQELRRKSQVSLDQVSRRMAEGEFHELNLIVKADVGGSVEALSDALLKLKTDEVAVNIIHSGVGAINESDIMLARASDAVILGFQVRPTSGAREAAEREEVDVRTYSIIYDAIEDVRDALEGLLSPERREETKGHAEVRETFKVPDVGMIAGAYVTDGTISRNHRIRLVREGVVQYEGRIDSLKRFQDDVKEVQSGYECGLSIENYNDLKVGDELESYVVVEERRTLEV